MVLDFIHVDQFKAVRVELQLASMGMTADAQPTYQPSGLAVFLDKLHSEELAASLLDEIPIVSWGSCCYSLHCRFFLSR
jgi:hypothetical protein